jgi:hypothetical protein
MATKGDGECVVRQTRRFIGVSARKRRCLPKRTCQRLLALSWFERKLATSREIVVCKTPGQYVNRVDDARLLSFHEIASCQLLRSGSNLQEAKRWQICVARSANVLGALRLRMASIAASMSSSMVAGIENIWAIGESALHVIRDRDARSEAEDIWLMFVQK